MQEMGLEPTRGRPRQILSLMRLPFRHSCTLLTTSCLSDMDYIIIGEHKTQAFFHLFFINGIYFL